MTKSEAAKPNKGEKPSAIAPSEKPSSIAPSTKPSAIAPKGREGDYPTHLPDGRPSREARLEDLRSASSKIRGPATLTLTDGTKVHTNISPEVDSLGAIRAGGKSYHHHEIARIEPQRPGDGQATDFKPFRNPMREALVTPDDIRAHLELLGGVQVPEDHPLRRALLEADDDGHFYGAWRGGPKSAGGGPGRAPTKEGRIKDLASKIGAKNVGRPGEKPGEKQTPVKAGDSKEVPTTAGATKAKGDWSKMTPAERSQWMDKTGKALGEKPMTVDQKINMKAKGSDLGGAIKAGQEKPTTPTSALAASLADTNHGRPPSRDQLRLSHGETVGSALYGATHGGDPAAIGNTLRAHYMSSEGKLPSLSQLQTTHGETVGAYIHGAINRPSPNALPGGRVSNATARAGMAGLNTGTRPPESLVTHRRDYERGMRRAGTLQRGEAGNLAMTADNIPAGTQIRAAKGVARPGNEPNIPQGTQGRVVSTANGQATIKWSNGVTTTERVTPDIGLVKVNPTSVGPKGAPKSYAPQAAKPSAEMQRRMDAIDRERSRPRVASGGTYASTSDRFAASSPRRAALAGELSNADYRASVERRSLAARTGAENARARAVATTPGRGSANATGADAQRAGFAARTLEARQRELNAQRGVSSMTHAGLSSERQPGLRSPSNPTGSAVVEVRNRISWLRDRATMIPKSDPEYARITSERDRLEALLR